MTSLSCVQINLPDQQTEQGFLLHYKCTSEWRESYNPWENSQNPEEELGFLGSTLKTSLQKPVKMRGVSPLCPRELLDSFDHSELEIAGLKGESLV